jgi:4-oxalocrotonate tautomerase
MPYVNIRVAGQLDKAQKAGQLDKAQKQEICESVTDVIARVANKPKNSILIFIDEVPHENIASSGKLLVKPSS